MRHGPNKLVFSTPQALHGNPSCCPFYHLYRTGAYSPDIDIYNNDRVTKSHVYELTITSGNPSIFNAIDKLQHREKRKLIGQAITEKAMRSFEPTMLEQIDVFIRQIELASSGTDSKPVNMTNLTKRLGADIVGQLAFGYAMNMQTDPTYRFVLQGLAVGAYQNNSFMQWPLLKKLGLHQLVALFAGYSSRMKYKDMLLTMIKARLSQDKHARNDLYSFVVDHLDRDGSKGGVKTSELWSEALFFFPAGGDTTTTAISALFFYLAHYRDAYTTLSSEIRNTFSDEISIVGGPKLASCRYLRACIDESLRLSPPVAGTLWRELYADQTDKGPFLVDGHVIPQGTQVGVSTYALHHDPDYFDDPFVFRPERWLTENRDVLARMNSAFNPFSVGARGCAGKAMAYLETSLVAAKTLWRFEFELARGKIGQVGMKNETGRDKVPAEFQLHDTFGSRHNGPNLTFRAREG